ncbi:MAG: hypothetical protein FWC61_03095 [Proteobacteria bacterium]|nr:hypothetical protein [Pseudomonadota bacterium]
MRKYIATAFVLILAACASEPPAPAPVPVMQPVARPICAAPAPTVAYDIPPYSFDGATYTFKVPYPQIDCVPPAPSGYAYPGPETVWRDPPQLIAPFVPAASAAAPSVVSGPYITHDELSAAMSELSAEIASIPIASENSVRRVGVYTNRPD